MAGIENFQMDIPEFQGPEEQWEHSESPASSELTCLWGLPTDLFLEDECYVDVTRPIALFGDRMVMSQSSAPLSELSDGGKGCHTARAQ